MDIVSGPYWYAGPSSPSGTRLHRQAVRYRRLLRELLRIHLRFQPRRLDRYRHHRLSRQGNIVVRESAGQVGAIGSGIMAFATVDNESPTFADITGDGVPELVFHTGGQFGYAEIPKTIRRSRGSFTRSRPIGDTSGSRTASASATSTATAGWTSSKRMAGGSNRRRRPKPDSGSFTRFNSPMPAARRCTPSM